MLYYMINKDAQIVLNGVSDTGNISMQDILMQMIFKALSEMTSHIFLVVDKFRGIHA